MKICLLIFQYFPQRGLTDPNEISEQLAAQGIDVSVVAIHRDNELEFEKAKGVKIYRIPLQTFRLFRLKNISFISQARKLLNQIQPDIVHVYSFFGCFLLPIYAAKKERKWLLDIRSSFTILRYSTLQREAINKFIGYQSIPFDAVGVLSKGIHEKIFGHNSTYPFNLIPLGANVDKFLNANTNIPQDIPNNFFKGKFILLYQGSVTPERKINVMVEAFALALSTTPELCLLIVGGGSALEAIKSQVAELDICQSVHFTGNIPYDEMPSYLSVADLALSYIPITEIYEHQPALKTAEYLAAGLPIVATNNGSNRFFMTDEVGILTNDTPDAFAEGILQLHKRQDELPTMAHKAVEIARLHDWKKITQSSIIPLYKSMLE